MNVSAAAAGGTTSVGTVVAGMSAGGTQRVSSVMLTGGMIGGFPTLIRTPRSLVSPTTTICGFRPKKEKEVE